MDRDERRRQVEAQRDHEAMLGRICMVWAVIDRQLDVVIRTLLRCSEIQAAAVTSGLADMASRCEMIKRLITIDHPGQAWRKWFIGLMDRISQELGPRRNRYIHDRWEVSPDGVTIRDRRARIVKPESYHEEVLIFDFSRASSMEELEKWESAALLVMSMTETALYDLRLWQREGRKLEPHPQYLPASKRNARWLTPREHAAALQAKKTPPEYVFD